MGNCVPFESLYPSRCLVSNGLRVESSELMLVPTDNYNGRRRIYKLGLPYSLTMLFEGGSCEIRVPTSFRTDLASLPIFAQIILGNRDDRGIMEAAIIHDWVCCRRLPAPIANGYMLLVMIVFGVPRWKRILILFGLTYFGYRSPISKFFKKAKEWDGKRRASS